jgi:cyclopropane-fatty-acyl-phospholipid synthase
MSAVPVAELEASVRTSEAQREYERARVAEHYERDPRIFSMVLDSGLAYATGIYLRADDDLETAQQRKYDYIRRLFALQPGERLLDIGCGWGSNMLYLAANTEAAFHGITLSSEQRAELLRRARERGLDDRIRVDLCHVEDLALPENSVDAVLFSGSIVHMRNRSEIHKTVARILKPGGRVLISDCYFPSQVRGDRASNATDYIFYQTLGYCLLLNLHEELRLMEAAGLDILHVQDLTSSYARTLSAWIDNVRRNRAQIEEIDPGFARVLQAYMTVAQLSFARRTALEYMILASKGAPGRNVTAMCFPEVHG